MKQIFAGTIIIAIGCVVIILRKKFINDIIKLNNKGLGFYKYGEKEKKIGRWFVPLFGLITLIVGFLILIGIFEFK